jgi:hypothetical protein
VYGAPYMSEKRVSVCVCGPSPDGLRRKACRAFDQELGVQCWRLAECKVAPVSTTPGGRVRLYEGRFEAVAAG